MIIPEFIRWTETARVSERAAAAAALARAYVTTDVPFEDRCAAEAAITLILDDPSSKVRYALAEALSTSRLAPLQVIAALAADQPEIAALIIARSPLLSDSDLVERVGSGHAKIQSLVAGRPRVSQSVAAAIAEAGEAEACRALLDNSGAQIAADSFHRIAERFGDLPDVREALFADRRLPAQTRLLLMERLGETLSQSALVKAVMGKAHAQRVARNACMRGSLTMLERATADEYPALIEHLRSSGDLTASFLIRAIAHGKVDFFGAAMVALTGQSDGRVRSLLASGFDTALCALMAKAGLTKATHGAILCALKVWRSVARGKRMAGPQEVSWLMLKAIGGEHATNEVAVLLKSIHLDALRANARGHALAIAAA